MTPSSNNRKPVEQKPFFFSSDLRCPCYFRVPLTCYTCVTALYRRCDSCPAGAPDALTCHVGAARNARFNVPCHVGRPGGGFRRCGKRGPGFRAADFLGVERRCEGAAGHRGDRLLPRRWRRRRRRRLRWRRHSFPHASRRTK